MISIFYVFFCVCLCVCMSLSLAIYSLLLSQKKIYKINLAKKFKRNTIIISI